MLYNVLFEIVEKWDDLGLINTQLGGVRLCPFPLVGLTPQLGLSLDPIGIGSALAHGQVFGSPSNK